MPAPLHIPYPGERRLVRLADVLITPARWLPRKRPSDHVRRVLLMRLERIGDLLMVLDAIHDARIAWPDAEIDLAVGAWNEAIAALIPDITRVHIATVPWLARTGDPSSWTDVLRRAWSWRSRQYDVVVNFEPDIRSNGLAWLTGAPARWGYATGGGGALLTDALSYDPGTHVSVNARRLVEHAAARPSAPPTSTRRLVVPPDARARGRGRLGSAARPFVGVHVSGGRPSKQWHLDRFRDVSRAISSARGATIVFTGSSADRPLVDTVKAGMEDVATIDLTGQLDLVDLAAVVGELDLLVTSDTGPMHLAAALGTPTVALFGPANPDRYGPVGTRATVIRVDLPCSPCGQVRLPPARCRGHVPDCMDGITVDRVVGAAIALLDTASTNASASVER